MNPDGRVLAIGGGGLFWYCVRSSSPSSTRVFNRVVSMLDEIFRLRWNSSKRVYPSKASCRISSVHHSPTCRTVVDNGQDRSSSRNRLAPAITPTSIAAGQVTSISAVILATSGRRHAG